MSSSHAVPSRSYSVHGIGVEIVASDTEVIEAMDLRLRGFPGAAASPTLRFEFIATGDGDTCCGKLVDAGGRPVYDTPYGSLRYFDEADVIGGELAGVELRCEPARGLAITRAREFTGRELYLATHPLATISLMELMERHSHFSLHAACLADEGGSGLLLSGPSGAGKSTLTMALAREGMSFLSDDVVFLSRVEDGGGVQVLGFADTVGVTGLVAERFAEFGEDALGDGPPEGFPKRLCRIEDLYGKPPVMSCDPRVIVFPHVAPDQPSMVTPLDPGDALLRLIPDVLLTGAVATQAHLDAIGQLLRQVRCYTLRSGSDLESAARLARALL